jgi:rhodanese-related sulfurtransferase
VNQSTAGEPVRQLTLEETWDMLSNDPGAVLVDVRTMAEWNFVGVPDLSSIGKEVRLVEWTSYPTGAPNPGFIDQTTEGVRPDQHILVLCRSGARSQAAAEALKGAGYANAHNVSAGFEGGVGPDRHRHGGWKEDLPWIQG